MFCHGTIFGSVIVYIASIEMSVRLRILLMLKSMHLDLHLEIDNWGILKTKLYDKRDFFTFPIVIENLSNTNPIKHRVNTGAPDVHAPLLSPVVLLLNDTE